MKKLTFSVKDCLLGLKQATVQCQRLYERVHLKRRISSEQIVREEGFTRLCRKVREPCILRFRERTMKMSGSTTIIFLIFGVLQISCSSGSLSIKELWRNRRIDKRFIPTVFKKSFTRRFPTAWLTGVKRRNTVNLSEQVDPSQFWLSGAVPVRRKSTSVMDNVYKDPYLLPIDSSRFSGLVDSYEESESYNRGQGANVFMEVDVRPSYVNYFGDQSIRGPKIKPNHLQPVAYSQTDWLRTFPCKVEDPYECYNYNQFYHPIGLDIGESNMPFQNNLIGYHDNVPFSSPSEKRKTFEIFVELGNNNKRASSM